MAQNKDEQERRGPEDELRHRLKAAIVYSGQTDQAISAKLSKGGPHTLRHWKVNGLPKANRRLILDALADACGLPTAFFFADFRRLDEIVPSATRREGGPDPVGTEQALRAARRAAQPGVDRRQARRERRTG